MSVYNTEVWLLSVPLENDYKHTLVFETQEKQIEYFKSRKILSMECTYQRKDNIIRFPAKYDTIIQANYVMFKNTENTSLPPWYFAFITNKEYINEAMTFIHIETDVLQTWRGLYTIKPSFVEREHVAIDSDNLKDNTVPENVELGEYICYRKNTDYKCTELLYVLQVTEKLSDDRPGVTYDKPTFTNYGGVCSAGYAYIFSSIGALQAKIEQYDNEAIIGVYTIPRSCIYDSWDGNANWIGQESPNKYSFLLDNPDRLGNITTTGFDYVPKNKKLLTFPYRYILLSNNCGISNILRYEDFKPTTDNKLEFKIKGVPSVGGSVKCSPANYKGCDENEEEGIMLGKFPTTSYSQDLYTMWLTQNAVNIGVGLASSAVSIGGGLVGMAGAFVGGGLGAFTGGATGMASGLLGVGSALGQIYQQSFTPNSANGNTNGGDILTCDSKNTFHFYHMGIKEEYAKIIDNYFSMFGYKINRVKKPNEWHRESYWYTKTIDVNIDSYYAPMGDIRKLKDIYNNGITFWNTPEHFGNYEVRNNTIEKE